jgi:hypothetical protein
MCNMKKYLMLLALGLGAIAFVSPTPAQAAGDKTSEARARAIHKCSVRAFNSAKEYNSSSIPWYTYATCMTERGQKP